MLSLSPTSGSGIHWLPFSRRRDGSVNLPAGARHGVIVLSNADGPTDFPSDAASYLLEQARPGGLLPP